MATQHAIERSEEHDESRKALKRRGILAAAATVVAGIMVKQTAQPVAAAAPMSYADTTVTVINTSLNPMGQTQLTGNYTTASPPADRAMFYVYNTSATGSGIEGFAGGSGEGVFAKSTTGVGVYGLSTSGKYAIQGVIPVTNGATGTTAVYGSNLSTVQNSHGLIGLADAAGHGLIGTSNSVSPQGGNYYAGLVGLGNNGSNAGNFYGNVQITGTLNGHSAIMVHSQVAVAHPDGTHRLTQAVVSPEGWLEDVGKGTLTNGQAAIKIAPEFIALAEMSDYHVFLTAHGDYNLHVAEMKADGFVVRVTSAGGGTQPAGGAPVGVSQVAKASGVTGTFSWKVMAKRKDGQAQRLATYTFPNIQAPKIPRPADSPPTP